MTMMNSLRSWWLMPMTMMMMMMMATPLLMTVNGQMSAGNMENDGDESMMCFGGGQDIPKNVRSELYKGQQAFTMSMLAAIQKATPDENIFFSPYSTYHALLLAYFGANGKSEHELATALNLNWAKNKRHVLSGYHLEKQNRLMRARTMPLEFAAADKIFFDKDIKLSDCMYDNFRDELDSMNFKENPEKCLEMINSWVANVTRNEIKDALSAGDVNSQTQMVLANSAYFKGQWTNQFDPVLTTQEIFYTSHDKSSFVPMMHKRGIYNLAIDEKIGAHILEMPYLTNNIDKKQSDISMIIILPPFADRNLSRVLSQLTPTTLEQAMAESLPKEIDISLPKFEFEQNIELLPILRNMGIRSIFDKDSDLSGFSTTTKLSFGDAKHIAKIKVDEEGSTAAAATFIFSFRSARPIEPTKFDCNHPFLFLIYDQVAKAVLFTGVYRDPKTQK